MPFSLKEYNLQPNATYRVSLVLNQGDKEIDTLRSFYSKTPNFFTKNLSDFVCYPIIKTNQNTTPATPGTTTGGVPVTIKINKLSWKLTGSNNSAIGTRKYVFTIYLNKVNKKKVSFTKQNLVVSKKSNKAWTQRVMEKIAVSGEISTNSPGIIKVTINSDLLGFSKKISPSDNKYYWSSDGTAPNKSGTDNAGVLPSFKYTPKIATSGAKPAYYKPVKTLQASVNSSIYQELVDTEDVKDIIFWLFSDTEEGLPTAINTDKANWKFLDFGFGPSVGNITATRKATGQNIYISSNNYYLPTYANASHLVNSTSIKNNGILEKTDVYTTSEAYAANATISNNNFSPTTFYVCFTIVRFTKKNNVWTREWLVQENGNASIPQISQIMLASVG